MRLLSLVAALVGPAAAVLLKPIHPQETLVFTEEIGPNDHQLVLFLDNVLRRDGLRYHISAPRQKKVGSSVSDSFVDNEEGSEDGFGYPITTTVRKRYAAPGTYRLEVTNTSARELELGIDMHKLARVNESNKDIAALRSLLGALQSAMDSLGSENYYLRAAQTRNIAEARFMGRVLVLLLLTPLATIAIGYFKFVLARQLVKPKGRRFKGLF